VAVTNAGDAVQIAATKNSVNIQGETGVGISAKGGPIRLIGDATSIETSKLNADTDVSRLKSKLNIIGGDRIVLNGTELIAHGDVASISGSAAALVLSSGAVLGSQSVVVNGNVAIRKGGISVSNIPTIDGSSERVNTPKGGCSLTVDGTIVTTGAIAASQQIVSADGVYARIMAAKNEKVGKLKTSPNKVKIGEHDPLSYEISGSLDTYNKILEYFRDLNKKALFTLKSKACAIWQPLFSKTRGKSKVSVAVDKDKNYIYPGESFWERDGMLLLEDTPSRLYDPELDYTKVGVKTLMLNEPNVEDVKDE
jgi:hypothetical protein